MGALAVVMAVVAYALYVWKSLRGEARPHPLSWLIFGVLGGTGYLVQLDQAAGPGSWVTGITAAVCLLLCVMSFWRGERAFPWYEWAFLVAAAIIFVFYLWSRRSRHPPRRPERSIAAFSHPPCAGDLGDARLDRQCDRLRSDGDQGLGPPALRQRQHVPAQRLEIRAGARRHGQHLGGDLRVPGHAW